MKKRILIGIVAATLLMQPVIFSNNNIVIAAEESEISTVDEDFDKINKIEFSQSFKLGEREYIVYYYMKSCRYCNLIKDKVVDFAKGNDYKEFYAVDMKEAANKYGWYSMKEHHQKYDIEIGKVNEDGSYTYYDGESENKYLDSKNIYYRIVKTNSDEEFEKYKKLNKNAEKNKIYAVDYTARIDMKNTDNFRVEGTPTAIWVKDGKIFKSAEGSDMVVQLLEEYKESKIK